MFKIDIKNYDKQIVVEPETKLTEIIELADLKPERPILGAKVNNRIRELTSKIYSDSVVEFIDTSYEDGFRMVQRGLIFLLYIASSELFPDRKLKVLHSIKNGLYCELGNWIKEEEIKRLKHRMSELVKRSLQFKKEKLPKKLAMKLFEKNGDYEKVRLFKYRKKSTVSVYRCGDLDHVNYFYGYMPPDTSCLNIFDLMTYGQGFLLLTPTTTSPDHLPHNRGLPKFSQVFLQYQRWGEILKIETIGDLNEKIACGKAREVIMMSEALHSKKISKVSEEIGKHIEKRLILLAGPSSSGKTTTAKRLSLQLMAEGMQPVTISLDDYFVGRDKTPLDEDGNYDFESIDALDLDLFNEHLIKLMDGKEVEIPKFDFITGTRKYVGNKLKVTKEQPIIVEGIHGLNEKLTQKIRRKHKFKIYISALTQLSIDHVNRIPTTDTRLVRRIVRDHRSRGYSAIRTISMWPSVRNGERRNIFPYQEEADFMFSSALVYELAILKVYAEQLLVQISEDDPENTESKRLLKFLEYFIPLTNVEDIPRNSIVREFIGGSIFEY